MPPKRKASSSAATPARSRSKSTRKNKGDGVEPVVDVDGPKPNPTATAAVIATAATKPSSSTSQTSTGGSGWKMTAAAIVAIVVAIMCVLVFNDTQPSAQRGPRSCGCITESHRQFVASDDSRRHLAASLIGRNGRVAGLHVRSDAVGGVEDRLEFVRRCGTVMRLPAVSSVDGLYKALSKSAESSPCIVWVAELSAIQPVAGALKELLEDNSLRGRRVLSPDGKGALLVVSEKGREELKDVMPHRVVHMLRSIDM